MLLSGYNLINDIRSFIDNSEGVILFCPYVKLKELKQINISEKVESIVVRWEFEDLCSGASDIDVFKYCVEQNIKLYRNNRIHLKAFWNKVDTVLFGSANISSRGLGIVKNYNYELNGINTNLRLRDIVYLEKILRSSKLITNDHYSDIKEKMKGCRPIQETNQEDLIKIKKDPFLLSELPMSESVDWFIKAYFDFESLSRNDLVYVAHDMALYDLEFGMDKDELLDNLTQKVNKQRFVVALKKTIKGSQRKSMHYGGVVKWIQNNTTTVPIPRSWEIKEKQLVNILYDWICYFDKNFIHYRPNHSQVIEYIGSYSEYKNVNKK